MYIIGNLLRIWNKNGIKTEKRGNKNGEGEIRTLEAPFDTHTLSGRAPSTTRPPLQKFTQ